MAAGSSVPGRWLRGALVVGWHPGGMGQSLFADRVDRVRGRMAELGLDAVLLSVGPDLPYLTGSQAMPLERLPYLVSPRETGRETGRGRRCQDRFISGVPP